MKHQATMRTAFVKGLRNGLPICLGYLSVSFTFGLMCTQNGLPVWVALLISMTNLTSAGQFAGTALIFSGGAIVEIAITTFIINIRYMLMSLSLSQRVEPSMTTGQRLLLSFGITDEVFAVAMQYPRRVSAVYLAGLIFTPYWGWALGTLLGATAADILPLALRSALGIAIYGMFIAIIVPPARKSRPITLILIVAAVLSTLLYYTPLSGGWSIIICAVVAAGWAALRYPIDNNDDTGPTATAGDGTPSTKAAEESTV